MSLTDEELSFMKHCRARLQCGLDLLREAYAEMREAREFCPSTLIARADALGVDVGDALDDLDKRLAQEEAR